MKFIIEINMINDAFSEYRSREVTRIIEEQLDKIAEFHISLGEIKSHPLFDKNGNKVGFLKIEE